MKPVLLDPRLLTEVERRVQRALIAVALYYLGQVQKRLSNDSVKRTGRQYWWYKGKLRPVNKYKAVPTWSVKHSWKLGGRLQPVGGRLYIASASGEPPGSITGTLKSRVGWRSQRERKHDIVVRFGSNVPYAKRLESDKKGGKYPGMNRPAWLPVMKEEMATINRIFATNFKDAPP